MSDYKIDEYGRVSLDGEGVFELWFRGGQIDGALIEQNADIIKFNDQCLAHDKREFSIEIDDRPPVPHSVRNKRWMIPDEFQQIDVSEYCLSLCSTDEERDRVRHEIALYRSHDMEPVLRALIHMVNVFRERKIVWGIGRGSSVASFVLYLIGVHKINSIDFGLDVQDFLR